jgi:hypothetical protein
MNMFTVQFEDGGLDYLHAATLAQARAAADGMYKGQEIISIRESTPEEVNAMIRAHTYMFHDDE